MFCGMTFRVSWHSRSYWRDVLWCHLISHQLFFRPLWLGQAKTRVLKLLKMMYVKEDHSNIRMIWQTTSSYVCYSWVKYCFGGVRVSQLLSVQCCVFVGFAFVLWLMPNCWCCSIICFLCSILQIILCPFGHCIVCPSSTYDFRLLLWYFPTILPMSFLDYPSVFSKKSWRYDQRNNDTKA
jgi:hypothetical protein